MARFSALAATALVVSSGASAAHLATSIYRDQAAEISSASRLVSAYGLVTSTFRSVAHNKAVGGVADSYHLLGRAIDIVRRPGVTHQQIEAALKRAGYSLIESLDEIDHSHFAFAAVASSASAAPQPSAPPAPAPAPKPLPPRVAADEHGTLTIDQETQTGTTASASVGSSKPESGTRHAPHGL
jgi:hypothetical protein